MSNDAPEKGNKKTKKEEPPPEHIIKQRIWRENQLNIFYKKAYDWIKLNKGIHHKKTINYFYG